MLDLATPVRELSFGDAIKEAIAEEMRRDPTIDTRRRGRTTFKVLTGSPTSSQDRIIDTPIEAALPASASAPR
jgi:hypothetical protein